MKKEPPVKREPTPDNDEDINRPPDDLSDEESTDANSEFGEEPCMKRRKVNESDDYEAMDRKPRRLPSEPPEIGGRLSNEPSNISASIFTTSQKKHDDELGELFSQPSQSRRRKNLTYSNNAIRNVHTEDPKPKGKKKARISPTKASQNDKAFKIFDMPEALSKGMHLFLQQTFCENTKTT